MDIELREIVYHPNLSEETNAYSASIFIEQIKVGTVVDHGEGGDPVFHFKSADVARVVEDYCKHMPPYRIDANGGAPMDMYLYFSLLAEREINRQLITQDLSRRTYYRLKSKHYEIDEWQVIDRPYSSETRAELVIKHNGDLGDIMNEHIEKYLTPVI